MFRFLNPQKMKNLTKRDQTWDPESRKDNKINDLIRHEK